MTIIIFNNTKMNIPAKLEELYTSRGEQLAIRDKAKAKIKEFNTQIKKLQTIARHAEDLFNEKEFDEASTKPLHENLLT